MAQIANAFTATGNSAQFMVRKKEFITYTVTGTFVGTWIFERSVDGTNWTQIDTGTGTQAATTVMNNLPDDAIYRFRCSAYTSGTLTGTMDEVTSEEISSITDATGKSIWTITEAGVAITGNLTVSGTTTTTGATAVSDNDFTITDDSDATKIAAFQASGITTATTRTFSFPDTTGTFGLTGQSRTILVSGIGKVGGTGGWAVGAAADTAYTATMAASQTAGTFVVQIPYLGVGDTITGFYPIAQIESAGNTATLDCDLRAHTNTAADPGDASVGAMTQVSVTEDTAVGIADIKSGLSHVVLATNSYYFLLTGTTAASTDIILLGVAIVFTDTSGS